MPGPFPGMDPYLEHAGLWPGFHHTFITAARALLNGLLPEGYVADPGERLYVVQSQRSLYPDVLVAALDPPPAPGTAAVATAPAVGDPSWMVTIAPVEVREYFIEIRSLIPPEQVVTVIEVLSPGNKAPGSEGQRQYRAKQESVAASDVSLIEIDLLRAGAHTVLAPREDLLERGAWHYLACLRRGSDPWRLQVWGTTVRERLRRIAVPLAGGDGDIELDLQAVVDRAYDEGAYPRRIDYRAEPPPPPFGADDAEWLDILLRERGFRG